MEKRILEITLHSAKIPVTGTGIKKSTAHMLNASLIWPRLGIAKKNSSQSLELTRGQADLAQLNWGKRILFRENVQGRFALGITISENLEYEELEKLLRFWAKAALGVTTQTVNLMVGPPLGKIAAAPVDYAARTIGTYPGVKNLVEGMVELDAAEMPQAGRSQLLTLRLSSMRKLVRVTQIPAKGSQPTKKRQRVLLEKGAANGELTLQITSL